MAWCTWSKVCFYPICHYRINLLSHIIKKAKCVSVIQKYVDIKYLTQSEMNCLKERNICWKVLQSGICFKTIWWERGKSIYIKKIWQNLNNCWISVMNIGEFIILCSPLLCISEVVDDNKWYRDHKLTDKIPSNICTNLRIQLK